MSRKSFIDSVEVKSACTEDWEKMHGNERVRYCDHCSKDVKNLSAITRKEAMRLVRSSGGALCIRYIKHPVTNRPLFADQLFQITRRAPGIAAGVMSASLSLSTLTYAQGGSSLTPSPPQVARSNQAIEPGETKIAPSIPANISGTVVDPNRAVVPNTRITLTNDKANETKSVMTNEGGEYKFDGVAPGPYIFQSEAHGFTNFVIHIDVVAETDMLLDVSLEIEQIEVSVKVLGVGGETETTVSGGIGMVEYETPLHRAVADDDLELVRELIALGENVNGKDDNYDKITPLFIAVENGNVEISRLLLDFGAKVNARTREKQTPIMRLDYDATLELVDLLLDNGVAVDQTANDGNTVLILAAGSVKSEVLQRLVNAGADVNLANKEGQTALLNAADSDILESVRLLLIAGAKANHKNKEGDTAWDLTSETEIEQLLVSFGAEATENADDTAVEPPDEN